ncbi:helix-turn-helix domain-containing protein [Pseudonocardia adelaidensis]|uniref:Helix-turn-helix domain-containing protein n=1 Tax=Pseudonocardia adelaidensis TaxID=648754 RepID=A0ABP9NS13_9PSEU
MAVLATPAASIVELGTPADVLTHHRYAVRYCAVEPGVVPLASGFSVEAVHGLDVLAAAHTVIVPGGPGRPLDPPPATSHALRTAAAHGARIAASGSGAFVLAAAGLLTGRRATTRHDLADDMRRRFPRVVVDISAPTVVDGGIRTCAGGPTTGEMCRELERHDDRPTADDLADVIEWATARLAQPLSLADLARAAHVSSRTLARRFEAAFGTSPMQWLLAQRIRRALHLLDTTCEPVERIARMTGFGSTSNFRLQFTRATGVSPQAHRRAARERDDLGARSAG